jgi:hypothetical protein
MLLLTSASPLHHDVNRDVQADLARVQQKVMHACMSGVLGVCECVVVYV